MIQYIIEYIEDKIQLLKLDTTERIILVGAHIAFLVCALMFVTFFMVLLNIGLSIWIGSLLGKYSYGLFIVAGFYLLLLILIFLFRRKCKIFFADLIIKLFLNLKK